MEIDVHYSRVTFPDTDSRLYSGEPIASAMVTIGDCICPWTTLSSTLNDEVWKI